MRDLGAVAGPSVSRSHASAATRCGMQIAHVRTCREPAAVPRACTADQRATVLHDGPRRRNARGSAVGHGVGRRVGRRSEAP